MHDYLVVLLPSFIAIIVMVALIKAVRLERLVRFDDETPVRETLNEHFEGQPVERIVLSEDQLSALAFMQDGPPILVRAMGDRMVVRRLNPGMVKSLSGTEAVLDLKLRDFTWPRARMVFENATARANAQSLIESHIADNSEAMAHA